MANDKELSTNDEVQRNKDFQSRVDIKEQVLDAIREVLQSTVEATIKSADYEMKDGHAGEYGDGTTYGIGAAEEKVNIKIAGKTKSFLQKQIILGTKSIVASVNIAINGDVVTIDYKSPEAAFGRPTDNNGHTYGINEKTNVSAKSISEFKSTITKLFSNYAKKEIGYLLSTKIGVDDKVEKGTTSIAESTTNPSLSIKKMFSDVVNLNETTMKKLTIKDLYFDLTQNLEEQNLAQKTKDNNTKDLSKTNPQAKGSDKKMFFDEEEKEEKDSIKKEITTSGPAISGSQGGFKDGASSGAGGYNTKNAWKNTSYAKGQVKRPKVTKDWQVVPEGENDSDNTEVTQKSDSKSKKDGSNGVVEPKDAKNFNPTANNGNYKNTNQKNAPSSDKDDFWQEIKLIPDSGYVPVGMDQNYISGMHDATNGDMKKRGYSEGEEKKDNLLTENCKNKTPQVKMPDLTRKKFFSLTENSEKGINKRYLITEKTTEEYEKERWQKLTSFKTYESIKEAEEMNEFFESLKENKQIVNPFQSKKLTENVNHDDLFNDTPSVNKELLNESASNSQEETVLVEKPGSKFGIEYKFFKNDFLNESKKYILDLNSRVFVPNPNSK